MASFSTALLWGLAILGAFAGWGRLAAFFLESGPSENIAASWLESPALGIALCAFLGGVLNLFSLAGARVVAATVVGGVVLLVIFALRARSGFQRVTTQRAGNLAFTALLTCILGLFALRFCSSVIIASFYPNSTMNGIPLNPSDDFQSYIVSVERMLQTGTIGLDPFNSRQLMSALGADHFLNGMIFTLLPYDNIHALESGAGLAAAGLAAAALGLRWHIGRIPSVALMLVPLLVELSFVNITSTMTSSAVLIALIPAVSHLVTKGSFDSSSIFRTGLLLAGACTLKTTAIPPACAFIAITAICVAVHSRKSAPIAGGLLASVAAFVFLLPWLIWQYRNGGTPLYPLLGTGFQSQAYNPIPFHLLHGYTTVIIFPNLKLPVTLFAATLFALFLPRTRPAALAAQGIPVAAFLVAWMMSLVILGETTQLPNIERYVASARLAGLLAWLAFIWRLGLVGATDNIILPRFTGPVALAASVMGLSPEWKADYFELLPANLSRSLEAKYFQWDTNFDEIRGMQALVPPGEKILVYLSAPFQMDFRRNTVYVADWPGESSPPPGMPIFKGGEAVSDYLLNQGIRYVAYSYKNEANFPRRIFNVYKMDGFGAVIQRQANESFAFQDNVVQLQHSRRVIFDDGQIVLLDLKFPASPAPP